MCLIMRAKLADRAPARFSETARSRPRLREARRHRPQVGCAFPVHARWLADDLPEGAAEGTQTGEPDVEADLAHVAVRLPQEEHRSFHPATLEVAVRGLAERGAEGADEVRLGDVRDPRQGPDVERPREVPVHRVTGAQHAAIGILDGSTHSELEVIPMRI